MVTTMNQNHERYTYQETCEVYLVDIKHKDIYQMVFYSV
jgi:hypothetical protein